MVNTVGVQTLISNNSFTNVFVIISTRDADHYCLLLSGFEIIKLEIGLQFKLSFVLDFFTQKF